MSYPTLESLCEYMLEGIEATTLAGVKARAEFEPLLHLGPGSKVTDIALPCPMCPEERIETTRFLPS